MSTGPTIPLKVRNLILAWHECSIWAIPRVDGRWMFLHQQIHLVSTQHISLLFFRSYFQLSFCKDSSENAAICFSCQRVSGYTIEHGIHASKWNDKCSQLFSICACHSDTCIGIWVGSTIFHTPPLQFEVWLTLQPILAFHLSNASFRATVWICILSSEENVYEFPLKSSGFGCFQHTA